MVVDKEILEPITMIKEVQVTVMEPRQVTETVSVPSLVKETIMEKENTRMIHTPTKIISLIQVPVQVCRNFPVTESVPKLVKIQRQVLVPKTLKAGEVMPQTADPSVHSPLHRATTIASPFNSPAQPANTGMVNHGRQDRSQVVHHSDDIRSSSQ